MSAELLRPLPRPTAISRPFWQGCREGRLLVQRCDHCGNHVFIPRTFCPECLSVALTWVESRGIGTIVTYTTVWRPQTPAFETPYVVAVVRLAEGYEMMTNIVDCDPADVSIGHSVCVHFVRVTPEVTLPGFHLVT